MDKNRYFARRPICEATYNIKEKSCEPFFKTLPGLGGLDVEHPLHHGGHLQATDEECVRFWPLRLHNLTS